MAICIIAMHAGNFSHTFLYLGLNMFMRLYFQKFHSRVLILECETNLIQLTNDKIVLHQCLKMQENKRIKLLLLI